MAAASVYEIYIEPERQEIPDARVIPKDAATKEKPSAEYIGMKKYLGLQ